MKYLLHDTLLLEKHAPDMGGVFTIGDLQILFGESNGVLLHRRIRALTQNNILRCFRRGVYITRKYIPELLVARLYPDAAISLVSVLAKALVVGTVPARTVFAVRPGPAHVIKGPDATLAVYHISGDMNFGTEVNNGIRYAVPEKAFLDTLYLYQKGRRFPFNIYTDMNLDDLKASRIRSYLARYRNPKFISFVKGILKTHGK